MYFWNSPVQGKSACQTKKCRTENGKQAAWYIVSCTEMNEVVMKVGEDVLVLVFTLLYWDSVVGYVILYAGGLIIRMWEEPCSRQEWTARLANSYTTEPIFITCKW
jgi:hypothetical protein